MFKKINCNSCLKSYDEALPKCPHCGEKNHTMTDKQIRNCKNTLILPVTQQATFFLVGWLGLKILSLIISFVALGIANVMFNGDQAQIEAWLYTIEPNMWMNFISYSIMLAAVIILMFVWKIFPLLKNSFTRLMPYCYGIIGLILILGFGYAYSAILNACHVEIPPNINEQISQGIVKQYPVAAVFMLGFFGPIVEEMTYRVGFFGFFKRINRITAYLVSIIIFTLIHCNFTIGMTQDALFAELINMPSYAFSALVFCYIYEKEGLGASLTAHILNNIYYVIIVSVSAS